MQEPLDLAPELARKKRMEDLELMRKMEKKHQFPISRYEITDILAELNLRYSQYKRQSLFSDDFKILQTVQDYRFMLIPLQQFPKKKLTLNERIAKSKIDMKSPIAQVGSKIIYINQDLTVFEVFTYSKPE